MVLLLFCLLTALPILLGAALGQRVGARCLWRCTWLYLLAMLAAWGSTSTTFAAGWFRPFGLLTPMLFGALVAVLVMLLAARLVRRSTKSCAHAGNGRVVGGLLGTIAAVVAWLLLPLFLLPTPSNSTRSEPVRSNPAVAASNNSTLTELASLAHRGLLRHLPVIGDVSDELAALLEVTAASPAQHRRLADQFGLQRLSELPNVQRALADEDVLHQLNELNRGSVLALYRLQNNARILDLVRCEAMRQLLDELRPTTLAAALRSQEPATSSR
jgi:hypothetical protein